MVNTQIYSMNKYRSRKLIFLSYAAKSLDLNLTKTFRLHPTLIKSPLMNPKIKNLIILSSLVFNLKSQLQNYDILQEFYSTRG